MYISPTSHTSPLIPQPPALARGQESTPSSLAKMLVHALKSCPEQACKSLWRVGGVYNKCGLCHVEINFVMFITDLITTNGYIT